MHCIDWESGEIDIFGNVNLPDYGGLDILITPFNVAWPIPRNKGGLDQGVSEDCEWDREKGMEFIFGEGTNLVIMSNVSRFQPFKFGEDSLIRSSYAELEFISSN